jgi:hypothetical protein
MTRGVLFLESGTRQTMWVILPTLSETSEVSPSEGRGHDRALLG